MSERTLRNRSKIELLIGKSLEQFLYEEYTLKQLSTHKVGALIGVGGITILRWLKRFGIPTRNLQASIRSRHELESDLVLTIEEEQVLLGSLLGDGGLYSSNQKTACFMEGHGLAQAPYLARKAVFLDRLKPVIRSFISSKTGKTEVALRTSTFPTLERLREVFYREKPPEEVVDRNKNTKIVPLVELEKLTPLALAIWYQDDGHLVDGKYGIRLNTCSFSLEEHDLLISYFLRKWNLVCKVEWSSLLKSTNKKYPYLKFSALEARKLIDIVEPFIEPCMSYKVPPKGAL